MKSIRSTSTVHAAEGDERIRTAVPAPSTDSAYESLPADAITGPGDYWDIIEAALVGLPETDRLRASSLAAFDHLKARVLARGAAS